MTTDKLPVYIRIPAGGYTLIDADDEAFVRTLTLYRHRHAAGDYVGASPHRDGPSFLHRILLGLKNGDGLEAHHVNGDRMDNRRSNLQVRTHAQNMYGQPVRKGKAIQFKGVFKKGRRFCVSIWRGTERVNIYGFTTPEEAARAYDAEAFRRWGEFAWLNFPPPGWVQAK